MLVKKLSLELRTKQPPQAPRRRRRPMSRAPLCAICRAWVSTGAAHTANFDEKVHKPQSKPYSIIGANMQLIFTHILWIWILLSVHHNFLGSKGLQGTHIDASNPFSSKLMTLIDPSWRFVNLFREFSPWCASGAWHTQKFWTSPLAPAVFEVLNTNWRPQSSFYVISGTLSFKFLTQALICTVVQSNQECKETSQSNVRVI